MADLPLALLGFLSPSVLGFAVYLHFFREKHLVEGLAFGWGVGGLLVNLLLLTANQIFAIPLAREWILPLSLGLLAISGLLFAWNREGLRRWSVGARTRVKESYGNPRTLLLLGPALLLPFLMLKAISYPETGPDSVFYHLFLAKDAFETGYLPRTGGLGWLELSNSFPNLIVTQQIWTFFVAGSAEEILSRPLVPVYAIFLAALVVRTGNEIRPGSGPLALLLLTSLTIPITVLPEFLTPTFLPFGRLSVEIWSDIPVAFYALLSVHFVLRAFHRKGLILWTAAGIGAGGAILTKYNGLVFVGFLGAFLLLFLLLDRRKSENRKIMTEPFTAFLTFLTPVVIISGLFFLKNQLLFGNPVYPFYTDVLGGTNLRSAQILTDFVPPGIEAIKEEQATVLLSSLLFLLFLPSLLLRGPQYRMIQATAIVYIAYILVGWNFMSAFYRMAIPSFPLVAISAGAWLERSVFESGGIFTRSVTGGFSIVALILQPQLYLVMALAALAGAALLHLPRAHRMQRRTRMGAIGLVFLVLSIGLTTPSLQAAAEAKYPTPTFGPLPVGLPRVGDDEILHRAYGGDWELWQWMNENLPEDTLIMTLHPGRYYVEARLVCPASVSLVAHYDASSLEEALEILRAGGVSYVLDSFFTRTYILSEPFWQQSIVFQSLENTTHFELVYQNPGHILYRIKT